MSTSSSHTCFFSFGPDDSFISKSYEGLRYHDLPPTLKTLLTNGSVLDVHWASLSPTPDSWVLSFKDSSSAHNLAWGPSTPPRLEKVLSKIAPSSLLRVFLGPASSYIAWDPTFIRWSNLPSSLEDTLQSWLTPSGWRAGPPRMVSWGLDDAFFAMSEYGDVAYRLGDRNREDWAIWRETIEEWRGEEGFQWSEVAYVALDPTTSDQFIALRNDGTWSGSISDDNSTALEAFAHNFFRRAKSKSHSKSKSPSRAPPPPPEATAPDPETIELYKQWATSTALLFASALAATAPASTSTPTDPTAPKSAPKKLQIRSHSSPATPDTRHPTLLTTFPYLPAALTLCALPLCTSAKVDPAGLRACKHDVERLLRASGTYGYDWLRQERLRWHPDRFGRLCEEGWREEGRKLAEEMFKIIDILIEEVGVGRGGERKG